MGEFWGMVKNGRREIILIWHVFLCRMWNVVKFCGRMVWYVVVAFFGGLFLTPFAGGIADGLRGVLISIVPDVLSWEYATYGWFYIGFFVAYAICATVVAVVMEKHSHHLVRDATYLCNSLRSDDPRLPSVSINQQVARILGTDEIALSGDLATFQSIVQNLVLENVTPILQWLNLQGSSSMSRVLVVGGVWGSGKTSSILMAVDSIDELRCGNMRYIYESAFKYCASVREFSQDILEALHEILMEMGIHTEEAISSIARNLDPDPLKTLEGVVKNNVFKSNKLLTSDLILQINQKYDSVKKRRRLRVVVILDDLDRLQGDELLSALSLLSILRRLKFVSIIVPVDLRAISYALARVSVYSPEDFIKKYLPEQESVEIKSDYEIIEQTALQFIMGKQEILPKDGTQYCAVWAAVLVKMVSARLHQNATNSEHPWNENGLRWLGMPRGVDATFPAGMDDESIRIVRGVKRHLDRVFLNMGPGSVSKKYKWELSKVATGGVQRFRNFILAISYSNDALVFDKTLSNEAYDDLIGSWIFDFARENWDDLSIALRELLDILNHCDLSGLSVEQGEQFSQVFDQLLKLDRW